MKYIKLDRTNKNNAAILTEKGLFPSFHFKVFLVNISSKNLKHTSKDTEFCGQFHDILQQNLYQNMSLIFSLLDRRS